MTITNTLIGRLILTVPVLAIVIAGSASLGAAATIGGVAVDATLTFNDPTEMVGPTDSIPVNVTLALAADSAAIETDAMGQVIGLDAADIAPYVFGSVSGVNLATDTLHTFLTDGIGCGNTFSPPCTTGPPYAFSFNFAPPAFIGQESFDLPPATSFSFLFGTFTPTGGPVPAGTYMLPEVVADIGVQDESLPMDPVIAIIDLADTSSQTPFTRTVIGSTPEPGSWALTLAGLALMGRRTRRTLKRRRA